MKKFFFILSILVLIFCIPVVVVGIEIGSWKLIALTLVVAFVASCVAIKTDEY